MANYCNRIIGAVELPKRRKATYVYQVNATMAVKLCRDYLRTPDADGAKLMRQIARYSEPVRLGRQDERNLKAKSFSASATALRLKTPNRPLVFLTQRFLRKGK